MNKLLYNSCNVWTNKRFITGKKEAKLRYVESCYLVGIDFETRIQLEKKAT